MESTILSPEAVTLIANVLKARETPISELASVISALRDGVDLLSRADSLIEPAGSANIVVALPPVPKPKAPKKRINVRVERPAMPEIDQVAATVDPELRQEIVEPPHTRLLRRADMLAHELEHHHEPIFAIPVSTTNKARGVVKWFDGKSLKGALRLMGMSADVPLNPDVMAISGIKRLYKDQEIEATVDHHDGRTRLVGLSLPGRNREPNPLDRLGGVSLNASKSVGMRHPKDVSIQIKHDVSRQRQARAAAENLLGKLDLIKTPQ